jgi:hypothetical protein
MLFFYYFIPQRGLDASDDDFFKILKVIISENLASLAYVPLSPKLKVTLYL